jgi:hypothetical protein
MEGTAVGKEVFTTLDGSESATATLYGIARFNMEDGSGRAIVIALLHTNSTGRLAPVDGIILAGHVQSHPDESSSVTYWERESGIPLLTRTTTITTAVPESEGRQQQQEKRSFTCFRCGQEIKLKRSPITLGGLG